MILYGLQAALIMSREVLPCFSETLHLMDALSNSQRF